MACRNWALHAIHNKQTAKWRSETRSLSSRADSGQGGDSRAGFGHRRDCRATFHHSEHSERPNVARRMSPEKACNVRMSPDNDSNVQISPDNARSVRMSPGIASPSQGTKRARKKFPSPYSVNGRKRRSARVAMRRARGILTHKSLDELSPNHIEHL